MEFGNAVEAAFLADVLPCLLASLRHLLWESTSELHDLGQMIIIFAEVFIRILFRVEKQLASKEFESHTGK